MRFNIYLVKAYTWECLQLRSFFYFSKVVKLTKRKNLSSTSFSNPWIAPLVPQYVNIVSVCGYVRSPFNTAVPAKKRFYISLKCFFFLKLQELIFWIDSYLLHNCYCSKSPIVCRGDLPCKLFHSLPYDAPFWASKWIGDHIRDLFPGPKLVRVFNGVFYDHWIPFFRRWGGTGRLLGG